PLDHNGPPDLEVRWGKRRRVPNEPPRGRVLACLGGGGVGYTHAATGRGYTLRFHATCEFRVSRDGRVIRVHATPGTTPETVASLVGGHVTALLLTLAGECVLHASAVAVDGAAIAFVGSPGMGKSTLAARLCTRGATFVTDDLLRLRQEGDGFRCHRGPPELRLRPDMRALVGDRPWAGTRQTEDARLAVRPRQVAPSLARLAAIVIPHGSPACTTLRLERLRGPDALFALLCHPKIRGWHAEDVVQRQFQTLGRVAAVVPVYRAEIPWGPAADAAAEWEGALQRLASLPGDFGFIHFQADGTATVVRSCGGLVPFYLWQDGGRAAVATRLGDLVCYILHQPRLDPLVNAVWASGWGLFPDGRTFLEGVAALERGSFAQTGPHRAVSTQRYWSPRVEAVPLPNAARQQEHAERLRELLLAQLRRNLDPAGGNLLSMSGGVDSSALASLAAGVVGRPLSTFSMLPEPSEPFRHEMSYIRPLLGGLRIERSWMLRLRPETRVELLRAGPRTVFHVPHYALCALPTLLRQAPIRVLFGGEFADEVCGSSYTWPDWVASVGLLALLRGFPQPPSGTHRVLRWGKHRLLAALHRPVLPFPPRLPEYIRPELQEEYRAWRHRRRDAATRDHAPRRYLALRAEEDGFLAMNWEAATTLGVRRFFPFFNRDVIELAFECHPTELVGPGTKKLLRRALRQDVPQIGR